MPMTYRPGALAARPLLWFTFLLGSAPGLAQPCFDLNADCQVNLLDYTSLASYLASFGDPVLSSSDAYDPLYDLDLDADVDSLDLALLTQTLLSAGGSYACTSFAYHWAVRDNRLESDHCLFNKNTMRWVMDTSVNLGALPVQRDAFDILQTKFGKYPMNGLHELFWSPETGYKNWSANYDLWMSDPETAEGHLDLIPKQVCDLLDPFLDEPRVLYVLIDYEQWFILWDETVLKSVPNDQPNDPGTVDNDWAQDWKQFVNMLHGQKWDAAFLARFKIKNPGGTGYKDLAATSPDAAAAFLARAWQNVARDFLLRTLDGARLAVAGRAASVKWSYGRWPLRRFLKDGYSDTWNPSASTVRALNDDLRWLWSAQDFFCPFLYVFKRSCNPGEHPKDAPPGDPCSTRWTNAAYIMVMLQECVRLRDLYNPSAEIIPWMSLFLEPNASGPLSDHDLFSSIGIARRAGADGVGIWRPIDNPGEGPIQQESYQTLMWIGGAPGAAGIVMLSATCGQ
jgi:hypothetical protein